MCVNYAGLQRSKVDLVAAVHVEEESGKHPSFYVGIFRLWLIFTPREISLRRRTRCIVLRNIQTPS